uniref:Galectin domain-containing protein n=1 Tax=Meloidogyne javanica TaxID=6303 RepID=A0A915LRF6_MELJA
MTNLTSVKGDAVLFEEPFITSPKLELKKNEKFYKHELDQLPFTGSIICFEGTLIPLSDAEGTEELEIIGDTLLKMDFRFSTDHEISSLKMYSKVYRGDKTNAKNHANPIGLSGVELTVRITVKETWFEIRFNEGKKFIKYNYVAPPWMVNWIMVRGNIDNVKFGNDAKRCSRYISKQLPPHITKIENLKEGQYISVKGKIANFDKNISINFYYGALGWDGSKKYFCDGVKHLTKLETGQIINMEIYQYEYKLPLWAIHYVVVTGPLTNIEGRNKIAEIRK